jgi:glucose dehydrogenase
MKPAFVCLALAVVAAIAAFAIAGESAPLDRAALLAAAHDDGNWILPAKTYAGNRYTNLAQINSGSVKSLRLTWRTAIEGDGEQEAAPLIWNGTMYVSTPHDGVLALDAGNGRLRWHRPYNPAYVILYAVNRGVGLGDGKVFIVTQDCRLIALDAATDTLFITPGNPGADMVMTRRKGNNLYTDSLVALDISGAQPHLKWYYQLMHNDTHDVDPAMIPVLFDGQVSGRTRPLVAIGDKGGNFVILDRRSGKVIHRLIVGTQRGLDHPPSLQGTEACPNHGGGIEWNGGAYDPASNSFLVASTEECALWKISSADPQYIPGQLYTGGPLPARQDGTGLLTAVDVSTGQVRWHQALTYPSVGGGVLITAGGVAFTSDVGGDLYAFDTKTGARIGRVRPAHPWSPQCRLTASAGASTWRSLSARPAANRLRICHRPPAAGYSPSRWRLHRPSPMIQAAK